MDTPRVMPRGEARGFTLRLLNQGDGERQPTLLRPMRLLVISGRRVQAAQPPSSLAQRTRKLRNSRLAAFARSLTRRYLGGERH